MSNSRRFVSEALKGELTIKRPLVAWFMLAVVALDLRAPVRDSICADNASRGMQETLAGEDRARSLAAPTEKQQQNGAQSAQQAGGRFRNNSRGQAHPLKRVAQRDRKPRIYRIDESSVSCSDG